MSQHTKEKFSATELTSIIHSTTKGILQQDGLKLHEIINLQHHYPRECELIDRISNDIADRLDLCQFKQHELAAIILSYSSVNYCHPLLYEKILDYFLENTWVLDIYGIIHLIWGVSQFFELPQELISKAIDALAEQDDEDTKLALARVSQIMFPGSRGICFNFLHNRCRHKKCPGGLIHLHNKNVIEMLLKLRYERAFAPPLEADESAVGNEANFGELFLFICMCGRFCACLIFWYFSLLCTHRCW